MVVRGPMALFGAMIAIGLGPAMWLGAQFGVDARPPRPPAIVGDRVQAPGGAGAGETPDDGTVGIIDTDVDQDRGSRPRKVKQPVGGRKPYVTPTTTSGPTPRKSSARPSASPTPSTTPSTSPSPSTDEPEVTTSPSAIPPVKLPRPRVAVNLVFGPAF